MEQSSSTDRIKIVLKKASSESEETEDAPNSFSATEYLILDQENQVGSFKISRFSYLENLDRHLLSDLEVAITAAEDREKVLNEFIKQFFSPENRFIALIEKGLVIKVPSESELEKYFLEIGYQKYRSCFEIKDKQKSPEGDSQLISAQIDSNPSFFALVDHYGFRHLQKGSVGGEIPEPSEVPSGDQGTEESNEAKKGRWEELISTLDYKSFTNLMNILECKDDKDFQTLSANFTKNQTQRTSQSLEDSNIVFVIDKSNYAESDNQTLVLGFFYVSESEPGSYYLESVYVRNDYIEVKDEIFTYCLNWVCQGLKDRESGGSGQGLSFVFALEDTFDEDCLEAVKGLFGSDLAKLSLLSLRN